MVTALFLACASVVISISAYRVERAELTAESRRRVELALSMLSDMAAPPLLQGDVLALADIVDRVVQGQPERVIIADRQGGVLADSRHERYGERLPFLRTVTASGERRIVRTDGLWQGAAPVRDYRGRFTGIVYVTFPSGRMDQALAQVTRTVLIFAVGSILLGALVAYLLGRYLSASLLPLLAGIRRTAGGDFLSTIPRTGTAELDEIGGSFNRMAQVIGGQVQDLSVLNLLTAGLMMAESLEEFSDRLADACSALLGGKALLLCGDPQVGVVSLVGEEQLIRRVLPASAAFVAVNERRAISIGRGSEMGPGYEVVEDVTLDCGIVAPLITTDRRTVGILVVEFNAGERPSPDSQEEVTVLAVANLAAPILAALVRSWTQEKAVAALRHILLPEDLPQPVGLEVYAYYEPAETTSGLGGDYYDVLHLGDDLWGLAIGDVSGKGLEAGRSTAMTKYVVRSFALEYRSPAKTIAQADRALTAQMGESEFVTIFFAVIDAGSRTLTYCNAGHPSGLLHSSASGGLETLEVGGGVVGFGQTGEFEEETVQLQVGDLLVLCTDGVLEARHENDEYGLERLGAVIQANAGRTLKNIAKAITEDVRTFTGNLIRDDMALLLARVTEMSE